MAALLQIASIIVSIVLIILILLQVRGGALGGLLGGGGGGGGITRTRRGLEKTLFNVTIFLSIAFLGISLFSVIAFS
jgi:preprotein translocase subunit SecG